MVRSSWKRGVRSNQCVLFDGLASFWPITIKLWLWKKWFKEKITVTLSKRYQIRSKQCLVVVISFKFQQKKILILIGCCWVHYICSFKLLKQSIFVCDLLLSNVNVNQSDLRMTCFKLPTNQNYKPRTQNCIVLLSVDWPIPCQQIKVKLEFSSPNLCMTFCRLFFV